MNLLAVPDIHASKCSVKYLCWILQTYEVQQLFTEVPSRSQMVLHFMLLIPIDLRFKNQSRHPLTQYPPDLFLNVWVQ